MELSPGLLYTLMIVVAGCLAALGLATTALNLGRSLHARRTTQRNAELRPKLLAAIYADSSPNLDLTGHSHDTFMALALALIPTLRGADKARLSELLDNAGVIDTALLELHARSAVRRAGGAELLGAASLPRAVPALIRRLDDRDADVRRTAARALGFIGSPDAVKPLLDTIDNRRVPLNTTTMALLRMPREANAGILEGLAWPSDSVRAVCAELLGLRSVISALPALMTALQDDPALEVRIRAARALGTIGAPTSVDALANALRRDEAPGLRAVATRALGRIGGPRTVTLLRDALGAAEHMVAMNAARALATIGDGGEEVLRFAAQDPTTRRGQYAREGLSYIELGRREEAKRVNVPSILREFNVLVLLYFVVLNSSYLVLIAIASFDVSRLTHRARFYGYDDIFANPLSPPVSIIVPAHNEEAVIVDSVRAMLALRYSELEVIVVDDGSTDGTFDRLREQFDLLRIERVIPKQLETLGAITAIYAARHDEPLIVVRKDSVGLRSDAVNAGIDLARYPLVCMVDADSILEEHALLPVVKPFVDDPEHVIATGGVVRVANGSKVNKGHVEDARHGSRLLPRIQNVEYVRSFLLGRLGWSRLGALLIISGAFGVFRRDVVLEVGGLDPKSLGEDAELVTTIHEYMRKNKREYRVVFVPEPVCWTEVPDTLAQLATQRRRWSRGLAQLMRKHRRMIGNPRYGTIGTLALPYYLAFELLGPIVEVSSVFALVAGLALGVVSPWFALLFALVAVGYGLFVSSCALTIEEFAFHRYHRWSDLPRSFIAAIAENVGFRQLHAWWRLRGLYDEVRGRESAWGEMVRRGFGEAAPVDAAAAETPAFVAPRVSVRAKSGD